MNDFWIFNFADILGIVLSIVSIIVASRIPHAIMKYKVEDDLTKNIGQMRQVFNSIRERLKIEPLTKQDFLSSFYNVDSLLMNYTKYIGWSMYCKELKLHFRLNRIISKAKSDSDLIDVTKVIILLCDYEQFVNTLNLKIGGNNNAKSKKRS